MNGKLFSSFKTGFKLAQGLQDSKTSDLNCWYEELVQKEALAKYLHPFCMSYHFLPFRKAHTAALS